MRRFVRNTIILLALMLGVLCAPGVCRAKEDPGTVPVYGNDIRDGSYEVEVESSSSMFRVVKAVLTVSDGKMTMDMTLSGTGYLKLFMGTGEEALGSGEENFIPFVEDDEGKYTYTIPVEAVDQEFDCAAFSKRKQKWYDRQLIIPASSLPEEALPEAGPKEPDQPPAQKQEPDGDDKMPAEKQESDGDYKQPVEIQEPDGDYTMEVTLNGGTGRASVVSPARIIISEGKATACIEWSSPDYDYMLVNGTQYFPVNEEGNSVFEIPVTALDEEMDVAADTVAMSQPHEIGYTLTFHSDTLQKAQGENGRPVAALLCIIAVLVLAAVGGCYVWKRHGRKDKEL